MTVSPLSALMIYRVKNIIYIYIYIYISKNNAKNDLLKFNYFCFCKEVLKNQFLKTGSLQNAN